MYWVRVWLGCDQPIQTCPFPRCHCAKYGRSRCNSKRVSKRVPKIWVLGPTHGLGCGEPIKTLGVTSGTKNLIILSQAKSLSILKI